MASIIEELKILLRFDAKEVINGARQTEDTLDDLRDTSRRTARDMGQSGTQAAGFFGAIRREALMLGGVLMGELGLSKVIKDTAQANQQTAFMAENIGLTANKLRAFEYAAEKAGGSAEGMNAELTRLGTVAAKLQGGQFNEASSMLGGDLFTRYGGDFRNMYEGGEKALDELQRVRDEIIKRAKTFGMTDEKAASQANLTMLSMGVNAGALNLLKLSREERARIVAIQEESTGLTKEETDEAKKLNSAWTGISQAKDKALKKVGQFFAPAAIHQLEWLEGFFNNIPLFLEKNKALKKVSDGVLVALESLAALRFAGVIASLLGLTTVVAALAAGSSALLAIAGGAAVGGVAGTYLYGKLGEMKDAKYGTKADKLGALIGKTAAFFGDDDAQAAVEANAEYDKTENVTGDKKARMMAVYEGLRAAGAPHVQAKNLTATVGRENDYDPKFMFGVHTDAANRATNLGMMSWQGDRAEKLRARMQAKGLMQSNKMSQTPEAIKEQAAFMWDEINSDRYKNKVGDFLTNPNVPRARAAEEMGRGFVGWAYGQNRLRSGEAFDWKKHLNKEHGYYNKIGELTDQQQAPVSPVPIVPTGSSQSTNTNIVEVTINANGADAREIGSEVHKQVQSAIAGDKMTTNYTSGMK